MSFQTLRLPRLSQLMPDAMGVGCVAVGLLQVTENDCTSSLQATQERALSSSKREVPSKLV